jgi:hypothetical protein
LPPTREADTQFLNVDLDIRAERGLDTLIECMGDAVIAMYQSADSAAVELSDQYPTLEETIAGFTALIESLPEQGRHIWDKCQSRSMNIGIRAGDEPHSIEFALSKESINRLAAMDCEIAITVYGARGERRDLPE